MRKFEDEGLLCLVYSVDYALIRSHEVVHLVPGWRTGSWQIAAPGIVLLYGCRFRQEGVKLPVMAEDDPALAGDLADPLVVGRLIPKVEFVLGVMVIFY